MAGLSPWVFRIRSSSNLHEFRACKWEQRSTLGYGWGFYFGFLAMANLSGIPRERHELARKLGYQFDPKTGEYLGRRRNGVFQSPDEVSLPDFPEAALKSGKPTGRHLRVLT